MFNNLMTSPWSLIAFILIVTATIGFVAVRNPSEKLHKSMWGTLAAGIVLLLVAAIMPGAPPPPPPERLTGDFSVPAYGSAGMPFQNYMSFPVTFEFTASGQWSMSALPDSITGPEGTGKIADGRYTLPGAPIGGLILRHGAKGDYEFVGNKITLEFQPGAKVLFLMNDYKTDSAYSDNTGFLKVSWSCLNCLEAD
jgi:hypothetical protein